MRAKHVLAATLAMAFISVAAAQTLLEDAMSQQTPVDAIYAGFSSGTVSWPDPALESPPETEGFTRMTMVGNSYYYLYYNIANTTVGSVDITQAPTGYATVLQFDCRYYQETGTYGDAPLRARLYTYDGTTYIGHLDVGYVYGVQWGDPSYPDWTHITVNLDDPTTYGSDAATSAAFDPTVVNNIRFWGTDWIGTGTDFVDVKNLKISIEELPVADAGEDMYVAGTCGSTSSVTLTVGPNATAGTYEWFIQGESIGTGSPLTLPAVMPGVYNVDLVVTNAVGLTATDSVRVEVGGLDAVTLPLQYAMDAQINHYGDSAYDVFTADEYSNLDFFVPSPDGPYIELWPVGASGVAGGDGGWWYGPIVNLMYDCKQPVDLTGVGVRIRVDARYFQDPYDYPSGDYDIYEDAPIMIRLWDVNGLAGSLGIVFGPTFDWGDPPPSTIDDLPWSTIVAPIVVEAGDLTDEGFDPSQVVKIEFFGTDWGGNGYDVVQFKNLQITQTVPPTADAGLDVTTQGVCAGTVSVALDGTGSTAGENPIAVYSWLLNGQEVATGATASVDLGIGVYTITLRVSDTGGVWSEDDVVVTVTGTQSLPVIIPFDSQINYDAGLDPAFDVIWAADGEFVTEGTDSFFRMNISDGAGKADWVWDFGPWVDLTNACYGAIDLTDPNAYVRFTARYNQDNSDSPYLDTAFGPVLVDSEGRHWFMDWVYPNSGMENEGDPYYADRYPNWLTVEAPPTQNGGFSWLNDADFDFAHVVMIKFIATNWYAGTIDDWIDIKDLEIGIAASGICADANCDGAINAFDIDPFVIALVNQTQWEATYSCDFLTSCDVNGDGAVNAFDIDPFVVALVGGGCSPN